MTCVDSVCTALSSASRKVTAMTLPRRACALLSFSREPTPACCVQNSLRSCLLVRPEIPLSGPPLIVCRVRLTVAARRKNSSPENLTHLHYNLLGKDSRKDVIHFTYAGAVYCCANAANCSTPLLRLHRKYIFHFCWRRGNLSPYGFGQRQ